MDAIVKDYLTSYEFMVRFEMDDDDDWYECKMCKEMNKLWESMSLYQRSQAVVGVSQLLEVMKKEDS